MTIMLPTGKIILTEPPTVGQHIMLMDGRRAKITKVQGITCDLELTGTPWVKLRAVWEVES